MCTRAKSLSGPFSLLLIALASAAFVACSPGDDQADWRNLRRWEDTRSLAPDSLASYLEQQHEECVVVAFRTHPLKRRISHIIFTRCSVVGVS